MFVKYITVSFALMACGVMAHANEACLAKSAQDYNVDVNLLKAIAKTESGFSAGAISPPNTNGTVDIGYMQINSSWLGKLGRDITKEALLDPCTNIQVGAWILANNIKTYGNTWKAVGAYNARTPSKQQVYVEKVRYAYNELVKVDFDISKATKVSNRSASAVGHVTNRPGVKRGFVVLGDSSSD